MEKTKIFLKDNTFSDRQNSNKYQKTKKYLGEKKIKNITRLKSNKK